MFSVISLELLCLVMIILTYARLRKSRIFSLNMVEGLTIYVPPSEQDFEDYKESVTPVKQRENAKGKKMKFDSRKSKNLPGKFPLRQMEMGRELLQYCNKFFQDFDFILMMFHYSVILFFIFTVLKLTIPPEFTQTNLTFYLAGTTLLLILANLRKGSFPSGYCQLTDETKV